MPICFIITIVKSTLATRLKERRLQLGLSQIELAAKAGIRSSSIHNYEVGLRDKPRKLLQLAEALQVSPHWLETGDLATSPDRANANQKPRMSVPVLDWNDAPRWKEIIDTRVHGLGNQLYINCPYGEYTYGLEIIDDSLLGGLFAPGVSMVIEPEQEPKNGDYVVVSNGSTVTIKKYLVDGAAVYLESIGNRFPVQPLSPDTQICGVLKELSKHF